MRLLLDTHVALWAITDSDRLTPQARGLISDPTNAVYVSAASIWEIAIKHALRRRGAGAMPISAAEALGWFEEAGYGFVAITAAHARAVEALQPIHSDPFDRILVAQSLVEPFRLLTHDQKVAQYSATVILV